MSSDEVLSLLDNNPISSDFLISVLWAAATNYKHDTLLRPFPSQYIREEQKDVDALVKDISWIPSISDIVQKKKPLTSSCMKLLEWTLRKRHWLLVYQPISQFNEILSLTGNASYKVTPQHILEVVYSEDAAKKFEQLESVHGKIHAYHGTRVENFHSILHNGLLSHMNKTSLFGEGTYLSSDLVVAMNFSPSGNVWPNSLFSSPVSTVALCEVINHPDVRCSAPGREHVTNKTGSSEGGAVPEKYYVVANNDHVRVKKILIFETSSSSRGNKSRNNNKWNWILQNKFLLLIIAYCVLLVLIGALRSQYFNQFI